MAQEALREQTPVIHYQIICENFITGGATVSKREINSSFNNSDLDHVTIQSDTLQEYDLSEEDLDNLEKDIEEKSMDEMVKEQNQMFFQQMKQSLAEYDKEQAKKFLGWITKSIGTIGSIITIQNALK